MRPSSLKRRPPIAIGQGGVAPQIGKHDGRSMVIFAARITFVNISSQMVQVFGVHRLDERRTRGMAPRSRRESARQMHLLPAPLADSRMVQSRHFRP